MSPPGLTATRPFSSTDPAATTAASSAVAGAGPSHRPTSVSLPISTVMRHSSGTSTIVSSGPMAAVACTPRTWGRRRDKAAERREGAAALARLGGRGGGSHQERRQRWRQGRVKTAGCKHQPCKKRRKNRPKQLVGRSPGTRQPKHTPKAAHSLQAGAAGGEREAHLVVVFVERELREARTVAQQPLLECLVAAGPPQGVGRRGRRSCTGREVIFTPACAERWSVAEVGYRVEKGRHGSCPSAQ